MKTSTIKVNYFVDKKWPPANSFNFEEKELAYQLYLALRQNNLIKIGNEECDGRPSLYAEIEVRDKRYENSD